MRDGLHWSPAAGDGVADACRQGGRCTGCQYRNWLVTVRDCRQVPPLTAWSLVWLDTVSQICSRLQHNRGCSKKDCSSKKINSKKQQQPHTHTKTQAPEAGVIFGGYWSLVPPPPPTLSRPVSRALADLDMDLHNLPSLDLDSKRYL